MIMNTLSYSMLSLMQINYDRTLKTKAVHLSNFMPPDIIIKNLSLQPILLAESLMPLVLICYVKPRSVL